jgi:glycosyltransferase involved in cell wall biosynthesis
MNPLVSVTMPSYQHARFLGAAIESVLNQTYENLELIIVDDGSTDGSLEIARSYEAKDSRVRVLTHENHANRGISETANLACSVINGEFWTGACSDDVMYPYRLEDQVRALEARPDAAWVYGYADVIDADGQIVPGERFIGVDITQGDPLEELLFTNRIPGMTVLARREAIKNLRHAASLVYSDWHYWLRLAARHRPLYLGDRPTGQYRRHASNTSLGVPQGENDARALAVLEAISKEAGFERVRALLHLQLAHYRFRVGKMDEAREALRAAFSAKPSPTFVNDWLMRWTAPNFHQWFLSHTGEAGGDAALREYRRRATADADLAQHEARHKLHPRRLARSIIYRLRRVTTGRRTPRR